MPGEKPGVKNVSIGGHKAVRASSPLQHLATNDGPLTRVLGGDPKVEDACGDSYPGGSVSEALVRKIAVGYRRRSSRSR